MKHLPKHLQPRWRYLGVAIETWADTTIDRRAFQREVWYTAQNLVGDAGSAEADLRVMRFSVRDGVGGAIVRVRRGTVDEARAVLACVDDVDGAPVGVRVRGVSGTVAACSESYLVTPTASSDQRTVAVEGSDRPARARDDIVDVTTPDGHLGATTRDFE
jgi:ribonuclease P/MRP protein subunit POP5